MTTHDHGERQARHDAAQLADPTHDASMCVCCCVDCTDDPSEREHYLRSLRGKRVEVILMRGPFMSMRGILTEFDQEGRRVQLNDKAQWYWPAEAVYECRR